MKTAVRWLLGVGGEALDPSGGAKVFMQKVAALGADAPAPFVYTDNTIVPGLQALAADVAIALCGDSAGCMQITQIAATIHPRKIAYMAMCQSSHLMPPVLIGDNVAVVHSFYTDWFKSVPPGMGDYKPQLVDPPDVPELLYPGSYVGNGGKTSISYFYRPVFHPGNDDPETQENHAGSDQEGAEWPDLRKHCSGGCCAASGRAVHAGPRCLNIPKPRHLWPMRNAGRFGKAKGSLVQGWGGQIGMALDPLDPIRDGTLYTPSDADRVATDWEPLNEADLVVVKQWLTK